MFMCKAFTRWLYQYFPVVFVCIGLFASGLIAADEAPQETGHTNGATSAPTSIQEGVSGVFGRTLSSEEVVALGSHIFPDGEQLPNDQGTVEAGLNIYQQQCASCHGGMGEGAIAVELVGDRTLLDSDFPDKGIGVYWPFAPTLFEYIQRSMPPESPGLLSNAELYSLVGYLLFLNGLQPANGTVDRQILMDIRLPNHDGFVDQFPFDR